MADQPQSDDLRSKLDPEEYERCKRIVRRLRKKFHTVRAAEGTTESLHGAIKKGSKSVALAERKVSFFTLAHRYLIERLRAVLAKKRGNGQPNDPLDNHGPPSCGVTDSAWLEDVLHAFRALKKTYPEVYRVFIAVKFGDEDPLNTDSGLLKELLGTFLTGGAAVADVEEEVKDRRDRRETPGRCAEGDDETDIATQAKVLKLNPDKVQSALKVAETFLRTKLRG